jgi:hypothetical protein
MKLIFSRQIFEKYSEINFMKIRSVGVELFHADGGAEGRADGRTDRYDEVNRQFSQFCERG